MIERDNSLPVFGRASVIVAGGSATGVAAAVAAARLPALPAPPAPTWPPPRPTTRVAARVVRVVGAGASAACG